MCLRTTGISILDNDIEILFMSYGILFLQCLCEPNEQLQQLSIDWLMNMKPFLSSNDTLSHWITVCFEFEQRCFCWEWSVCLYWFLALKKKLKFRSCKTCKWNKEIIHKGCLKKLVHKRDVQLNLFHDLTRIMILDFA